MLREAFYYLSVCMSVKQGFCWSVSAGLKLGWEFDAAVVVLG